MLFRSNVVAVIALVAFGYIPTLVVIPFIAMFLEVIYGALIKPGIGAKPVTIGVRQVVMTILFATLMIFTYR